MPSPAREGSRICLVVNRAEVAKNRGIIDFRVITSAKRMHGYMWLAYLLIGNGLLTTFNSLLSTTPPDGVH